MKDDAVMTYLNGIEATVTQMKSTKDTEKRNNLRTSIRRQIDQLIDMEKHFSDDCQRISRAARAEFEEALQEPAGV